MGRMRKHLSEVVEQTWNFAGRIKTPEGHLLNAFIGLASEAGETLDNIKKMCFHSEKPAGFYREKILSELGDVIYYWLKAVDLMGFSVKEVLDYNRKKLASRHPELGEVTERFGKEMIK